MDQYFHGNVVSPHIRHRTELHKKWTQLWSACWKCTSQYHVGQSVKSVLLSLIIFAPYMFDVDPLILPCSNIQWCLSPSLSLYRAWLLAVSQRCPLQQTMVCPVVFNQFSALYSCRQCYHCSNTNMSTGWAARNVSTAPPHPHPSCAAEKMMLRKAAFHAYGFRELGREHHQNDQTMRDSMMILNVMPGSLNWPSWGLSIKTATHHFTSSVITRHNCMTQIQVSGLRFCLHYLCKHLFFFASRILL